MFHLFLQSFKVFFSLCFMYEETEIQKGLVIFPMLYSQYKGLICALNYSMFLAILFFFSAKVTSLKSLVKLQV